MQSEEVKEIKGLGERESEWMELQLLFMGLRGEFVCNLRAFNISSQQLSVKQMPLNSARELLPTLSLSLSLSLPPAAAADAAADAATVKGLL